VENGSSQVSCDDSLLYCILEVGLKTDFSLRSATFADVTRDFRGPDGFTVLIPDWRNRQRDLYQGSIFALSYGFVMLNALTATNLLQNCRLFVEMIGGDEGPHAVARRLLCRICEN